MKSRVEKFVHGLTGDRHGPFQVNDVMARQLLRLRSSAEMDLTRHGNRQQRQLKLPIDLPPTLVERCDELTKRRLVIPDSFRKVISCKGLNMGVNESGAGSS